MNFDRSLHSAIIFLLFASFALAPAAQAEERHFQPVPQSAAQVVKVVGDASIISAVAKQFHAGALIAPNSSRKAWLSVSVKNVGTVPIAFGDDAVSALAGDKPLAIRDAAEAIKEAKGEGLVRDPCANATASSQRNCNIDVFNKQQAKRTSEESPDAKAAAQQLAPGELRVRQYELELPKKADDAPATIKIVVTLAGEQISFDFKEVQ